VSAGEVTRMSKSRTQSLAAIGDSRVITGEPFAFAQDKLREARDPVSWAERRWIPHPDNNTRGQALRGNDGSSGVIGVRMSRNL
jgi:hypothetical protein